MIRARQPDATLAIQDTTLAIQCELRQSLTSAFALAVLTDELGAGFETEALQRLLRRDRNGIMAPNPLVVRLADDRLWRYGALDAALAAVSPRFAAVRDHWSRVAAGRDGARPAPRPGGERRTRRTRACDQDTADVWE